MALLYKHRQNRLDAKLDETIEEMLFDLCHSVFIDWLLIVMPLISLIPLQLDHPEEKVK